MAKGYIYFTRILTVIIVLCIAAYIMVPRHMTASEAQNVLQDYIEDRIDVNKYNIELLRFDIMYLKNQQNVIKNVNELNTITSLANIFDPQLKYYVAEYKLTDSEGDTNVYLNIDAYSGFIWESEDVLWENF